MQVSLNRRLVDEALAKRGVTLEDFIRGGRQMGKTIDQLYPELVNTTGVQFSRRTLYRWAQRLEQVSA